MQPGKMTDSEAAAKSSTVVAVPVHEVGTANKAQRSPTHDDPDTHRVFDHGKEHFDGHLGAGRGLDIRRADLGVLHPAAATNDPAGAVSYNSGVFAQQLGLGVGLNEDLLGVLRRADKEGLGAVYYHSDSHADEVTGGPVAAACRNKAGAGGALAGHARRFLPFIGILAASSAVTGLAAGTASPPVVFGLFVLLLGGLSLVTLRVLGA